MTDRKEITRILQVPEEMANNRLDQVLAKLCPDYSRAQLQQWIKQGDVQLDQMICTKPRQKVSAHQSIEINASLMIHTESQGQDIPLDIVFEDASLLVINKPAGLVVHPGAGNPDRTLVNALLYHYPDLKNVTRAGVIHRLDKDTTGLLLIAKTLASHTKLSEMLKAREIKRHYITLVKGTLISGGTIDQPIGRHPTHRLKQAVTPSGREAITHYRIKEKFSTHTLLNVKLETGRTHQIRVHMNSIHHPIVGDQLYGKHIALPASLSESARDCIAQFKRQALHAAQLELTHPESQEYLQFTAPLPDDFQALLAALRVN